MLLLHAAGGSGSGGYSSTDMAVLGAILAVLLVISLGIIGFLAYRVQKGKAAWGKLFEASVFRSSVSSVEYLQMCLVHVIEHYAILH